MAFTWWIDEPMIRASRNPADEDLARLRSEGYIAFVEEPPGANAHGDILEEARSNLQEAVQLVVEANRALSKEAMRDKSVIREPLAQIS
jgi:predicted RNase H-like HicB family nuclease